MANRLIISKKSQGQMFEPAGELHLVFAGHENIPIIIVNWILKKQLQKHLIPLMMSITQGKPSHHFQTV